jgi:hypothetical protein
MAKEHIEFVKIVGGILKLVLPEKVHHMDAQAVNEDYH